MVAYGQIPVPLVYTQVVTLAVYTYFAVSLVGEQWTEEENIDTYYPIFMTVKFLFYFGWLRVAETLYNPFGEDDDDFEINDLLDRHFRVSLAMVEDREEAPALQKDVFWDVTDAALVRAMSRLHEELTICNYFAALKPPFIFTPFPALLAQPSHSSCLVAAICSPDMELNVQVFPELRKIAQFQSNPKFN